MDDKNWIFLVELAGDPPLAVLRMCEVDLSSEDDRGDVEPYVDYEGKVHCMLGVDPELGEGEEEPDDPEERLLRGRRQIMGVWEYTPGKSFQNKFPTYKAVSVVDFVRRFCEAAAFDGDSEEEIASLKKHYGV